MMRVVRATRFGGPEVLQLGEAPEPVPGPDEMVVDVFVAEVLFLDTLLRAGWGREYFDVRPPYVPGVGVAGVVSAVGAGVDDTWVGRRVIAGLSGEGRYAGGGYAERVVAGRHAVLELPDALRMTEAIAALHDGLMAVSRLEKGRVRPGDRVLVTAAGGSIGTLLLPLAARAGATVIAAARGERKLALSRERGAEITVDYTEPDWADHVGSALRGAPVDVVFDGAGGSIGAAAFELTASGSRFFSYGAATGAFPDIADAAKRRGVTVIGLDEALGPDDRRRYAAAALAHLGAGDLKPVIGQAVPLDRAADAHAAMEERTVAGKTVLLTGTPEPPGR